MRDGFGRNIAYLRLSVTDLCNYRCIYCMPPEGVCKLRHEEILSVEECIRIAAAAVDCGIRKIRITGGEPLVRRGILSICEGIARLPGVEELTLTTNGARLEELAQDLKQAGVSRLNLSIDSLNSARYAELTRGGDLEKTWRGIEKAEAVGFTNLKFNTVLMGGKNDSEIEDFVRLTKENAWQVRFIELMPIGACTDWQQAHFLPAQTVLARCPELKPLAESGVASLYQAEGYRGTVGLITPMSHHFCSQCNRIRVTADGRLKPCLHSDAEIPIKNLDDAQLCESLRRGIMEKPLCHGMNEEHKSASHRGMSEIGG